jgi:SAM-dependent methyltransferase
MSPEEPEKQDEFTWEGYYEWIEGREPRPLFVEALGKFKSSTTDKPHAVDLGCGDGTETLALLEEGWTVLAIDREPAAISYVQSKVQDELQTHLKTRIQSFKDLNLPDADLVYAGFSLPFCRPEYFDRMWANVADHIRPGGRFVGQLFGIRDTWAEEPKMTFHSSEQVKSMFVDDFEIEALEEIEEEGEAFSGPKHWHIFDIIARKL